MSYSGNLKEELLSKVPKARHCRIAEMAGIFSFLGTVSGEGDSLSIGLKTEQEGLRDLFRILLRKTGWDRMPGGTEAAEFLQLLRYRREDPSVTDRMLLMQWCCRRAYLRGCFLSGGSMTDPDKGYHFEIVARTKSQAAEICSVMESFELHPKTVARQGHPVVYLKEADEISDMLNVMESTSALLSFENTRVEKGMNNAVNRKVNCETANIGKMVHAAVREVGDIEYLKKAGAFGSLPDRLRETAELRLSHPEWSLSELGSHLNPPVGKSGVNHRLRKIGSIADTVRKQEESKHGKGSRCTDE